MKYLSDYIEEKQSTLFKKHGVFFAFSDKQYQEQKKEGVKYVSLGMGTLCPKENAKAFIDEHHDLVKAGIAQDVEENGIDGVIIRELGNHEAFYTGDAESTVDALDGYPTTKEYIWQLFRKEDSRRANEEWEKIKV